MGSHDCRREGKHAKINDSYRRTEPDCLARGPSSPEKERKRLSESTHWNSKLDYVTFLVGSPRMDTFGQSIIAAPQQPTLGNSTVLTTLSIFETRQIQKHKGAAFTSDINIAMAFWG